MWSSCNSKWNQISVYFGDTAKESIAMGFDLVFWGDKHRKYFDYVEEISLCQLKQVTWYFIKSMYLDKATDLWKVKLIKYWYP